MSDPVRAYATGSGFMHNQRNNARGARHSGRSGAGGDAEVGALAR